MMFETSRPARAIRVVLLITLALSGCSSDDGDDAATTGMMAGAVAGIGGAGGTTGGGAGGAAGAMVAGGTSGGIGGVGATSGGVGGAGGMTGGAGGVGGTTGGTGGDAGGAATGSGGSGGSPDAGMVTRFSFFVTSWEGMKRLANEAGVEPADQGFGGDLGGLEGADMICQTLAEAVGDSGKTWRAFLSATTGGEGGGPVHAIERIGAGPWYDANDRLVAENIEGLLNVRPDGDPQSVDDLPDENGLPNSELGDTHDVLTGSGDDGRLSDGANAADTCQNWTDRTQEGGGDNIMCGHSWPRCAMFGGCEGGGPFGDMGSNWISDHPVQGCKPGINFEQDGAGTPGQYTVGAGGGYGAIYCFAILP